MKWMRNYRLTVQAEEDSEGNVEDIVISQPTTIEFNVVRNKMASLNSATFQIYNLAPETYRRIFQDRFTYYRGEKITQESLSSGKYLRYRRVVFEVGYGGQYFEIFRGNMFQSRTERKGTEVITFIDARDGGFDVSTTKTSETFQTLDLRNIILNLMGKFPNISAGAVSEDMGTVQRPVSVHGNTYESLKTYSENTVFIDSEKLYVLRPNEVVVPPEFVGPLQSGQIRGIAETGDAPLIAPETGMLSTPRKDDSYITVSTLLEPRIRMGAMCQLRSDVMPIFDGIYPVVSIHHSGTVSGAVSGQAVSTFGLYATEAYYGKLVGIPMIRRISFDK